MTDIERSSDPTYEDIPPLIPGAFEQGPIGKRANPSTFSAGLSRTLASEIVSQHLTPDIQRVSFYGVEAARVDQRVTEMLRKRKFNGYVANERAVIVPPEPSDTGRVTKPVSEGDMRAFIGAIDLLSTGRGNVGTFTYKVTIALLDMKAFGAYVQPDFAVRMQAIDARAIQALIAESSGKWSRATTSALRNLLHAGLPGLGKR